MSIPSAKQAASRTRDKLSLLRSHALFRDLPPAVIDHLGSYMKTRGVKRGTTLFTKRDPRPGVMGVLARTGKVSVASGDRKDKVVNIFYAGGNFCESAFVA